MNEELAQRGYYVGGQLSGDKFGLFERLSIGATSLSTLVKAGLQAELPKEVGFPFTVFSPPKSVARSKPDGLVCRRIDDDLYAVAVVENKAEHELSSAAQRVAAAEQALFYALALGCPIAVFTDGSDHWFVDVAEILESGVVAVPATPRPFTPAIVAEAAADEGGVKDPTPLAESVWQHIWHATKAEPKDCLLTFVEIFVLKFLSDNLPAKVLPAAYRFQEVLSDPSEFKERHGRTAIEYYVGEVRPKIKQLFPDNVVAKEAGLAGRRSNQEAWGTCASSPSPWAGCARAAAGTRGSSVALAMRAHADVCDLHRVE